MKDFYGVSSCDKKPQKVPLVYFVCVQIPYKMYGHPTFYPTFSPGPYHLSAKRLTYCTLELKHRSLVALVEEFGAERTGELYNPN